jgi:hypothetical protein
LTVTGTNLPMETFVTAHSVQSVSRRKSAPTSRTRQVPGMDPEGVKQDSNNLRRDMADAHLARQVQSVEFSRPRIIDIKQSI